MVEKETAVKAGTIDCKNDEGAVSAVKRLGVFLLIAIAGGLISHFSPHGARLNVDGISAYAARLGPWGPLVILVLGIVTPLLFIPRWPLAFLGGLLYGVVWGTLLATFASTLGATLHFTLSQTLLAPVSDRLRKKFKIERFVVPKHREFTAIFLMRAFPLTNFVATNLIAGALRMNRTKFVIASFFGMIPSSLMYASWGKLMKKPSPHFYLVAAAAFVLIVVGTVIAGPIIRKWQAGQNDS